MNDISEKSKDLGKTSKKGQAVEATKDDLEPCEQPQAQEALRTNKSDEACDDGVD
jgi:hypothetical protein